MLLQNSWLHKPLTVLMSERAIIKNKFCSCCRDFLFPIGVELINLWLSKNIKNEEQPSRLWWFVYMLKLVYQSGLPIYHHIKYQKHVQHFTEEGQTVPLTHSYFTQTQSPGLSGGINGGVSQPAKGGKSIHPKNHELCEWIYTTDSKMNSSQCRDSWHEKKQYTMGKIRHVTKN